MMFFISDSKSKEGIGVLSVDFQNEFAIHFKPNPCLLPSNRKTYPVLIEWWQRVEECAFNYILTSNN